MGFTKVKIEIGQAKHKNGSSIFKKVSDAEVLVDTGATYSTLPADLLKNCGVSSERSVSLRLADGRTVKRTMGYVWMVVEGIRIHTPVLFGEPDDPSLLGVIALEDANLSVDSVTRQLLKGTSYIQY